MLVRGLYVSTNVLQGNIQYILVLAVETIVSASLDQEKIFTNESQVKISTSVIVRR